MRHEVNNLESSVVVQELEFAINRALYGLFYTVFSYFPFGFEGRMWDLIVSVPDHCLSFYFLFCEA